MQTLTSGVLAPLSIRQLPGRSLPPGLFLTATIAAPTTSTTATIGRLSCPLGGLVIGRVELRLVVVKEYRPAFFGHRTPAICAGRHEKGGQFAAEDRAINPKW
jgi:hypothetical protein